MILFDVITLETVIKGCTNPDSPNYNPNATVDDGSCLSVDFGTCVDNAINSISLANCNSKESKKTLKLYSIYQSLLSSIKEKNSVKVEKYKAKLAELCDCKTC